MTNKQMILRISACLVVIGLLFLVFIDALADDANTNVTCGEYPLQFSLDADIESDSISAQITSRYADSMVPAKLKGIFSLFDTYGNELASGELVGISPGMLGFDLRTTSGDQTPDILRIEVSDETMCDRFEPTRNVFLNAPSKETYPSTNSQSGKEAAVAWYKLDANRNEVHHLVNASQMNDLENNKSAATPVATGGPDEFGYTYDDGVTYNWIDATGGTEGPTGDDRFGGPYDIGFDFNYYGIHYDEFFISTNGVVTFGYGSSSLSNRPIPYKDTPNNLIAPFWDDLNQSSGGNIYFRRYGSAPNRYTVVEWHEVHRYGTEDPQTFEMIIYENGDINFQYKTMTGEYGAGGSATIGIENDFGDIGLQYSYNAEVVSDGKAITFRYPRMSQPNVWVRPQSTGSLVNPGVSKDYTLQVINIGFSGDDVYNLSVSSIWPVKFLDEDGVPLSDTNHDGAADTGSVPQGEHVNVIAQVTAPSSIGAGRGNTARVTISSALAPAKQRETTITSTVSGSFAQVFYENYARDKSTDTESYLDFNQSNTHLRFQATNDDVSSSSTSVATTSSGNIVYAWTRYYDNGEAIVGEVQFMVYDSDSDIVVPTRTVTDHSSATEPVEDIALSLATFPNGNVIIVWTRRPDPENIYYVVYDASGSLVRGPTALTSNSGEGVPNDISSAVATTGDSRAIVAWQHSFDGIADIYYAVLSSTGNIIRSPADLTSNTGDYDDIAPRLTMLSGNKILASWICEYFNTYTNEICYAVLNSSGNLTLNEQVLTANGVSGAESFAPDAAQLLDGSIAIAWNQVAYGESFIQGATLDSSFTLSGGPVQFYNPHSTSNHYVSVAEDEGGFVNLSWLDGSADYLYYATMDRNANVMAAPTIYREAENGYIWSSLNGYGIVPLREGAVLPTPTPTPTPFPRDIYSPRASKAPTINGVVDVNEWSDALHWDVSGTAGAGEPVMMYIKHDDRYLYLAYVDYNDSSISSGNYDQFGLYFDDEGGTPPILYDRAWTHDSCNEYPGGEGNYWIGDFSGRQVDWREIVSGPNYCDPLSNPANVLGVVASTNGVRSYESRIDMTSSAFRANARFDEIVGVRIYVLDADSDSANAWWPADSIWNDPSTYGRLSFVTPTPTPTDTPTSTPTPTPTNTPTYTPTRPTGVYLPMLYNGLTKDPHEPNNSRGEAWGPLQSGQHYWSYMYAEEDRWDVFYFDMTSSHSVEVWLQNVPTGANYSLQVRDIDNNLLGYSGNPGNADEHIRVDNLASGRYFVMISRAAGTGFSAVEPYSLRVVYR